MRSLHRALNCVFLGLLLASCQTSGRRGPDQPGRNPLEAELRGPASIARQEGIAVAVLIDTSGSMKGRVTDVDGLPKAKLAVAQRALLNLERQLDEFSRKNPERKLLVGIYEFSSRDGAPPCREVIRLGPPNLTEAEAALEMLQANGGTPIGNAMIKAKRDLDGTGLSRRHILVITDGENNRGYSPGDVANAISRQAEDDRASIYFIAFDVASERFGGVRDAGGLVLSAANESDLRQTLDFVLTGKILAEQPATAPAR